MPKQEISNIKELIQYQSGAVVSRTIIKKKTGTITLFAFDAGEGLSEHTAPFDAFVQILEGEALITISGDSYLVKENETILLPANEPHGLKAKTQFKMLLTMIRSEE
ncbi:MAG: cupin domain-containing protein [Ignavibacteriales bacterium]|nr:cupin domain-containing protein [Ignavibacteriales bacterium]